MKDISSSKIVLVTHYRIYSASQALRDYLRRNKSNLLYISHPLPLSDTNIEDDSYFELSSGEDITKSSNAKRSKTNIFISSFYDFFLTLFWTIKNGHNDLFIGVDNLNTLPGVILKKLGLVKKVVYYTIDYFPTRFENELLNSVYHLIDKICVANSDETWNVSSAMVSARKDKNNMRGEEYSRQYTAPIGVWYDSAPRKAFADINKKKIIFVGHLLPHMGVDLVVSAMPQILKTIPDARLEIIGGGQQEGRLKKLAKKLKVEKNIKFWGWIRDRKKLEEIMSDGAIGLATFNTQILDEKVKNADPGKIKDYMLLGMPVIVTGAISNSEQLEKSGAALVIDYDISELTRAVVQLLSSQALLRKYRENALKYVAKFDYNLIFQENISRVLNK